MLETDDFEGAGRSGDDDRANVERASPQLTAEEFWARIEAPLR